MNGMNNNWGLEFGIGWITGMIVLIVLIVLIFLMFRALNKKRNPNLMNKKSLLDILKMRYSRGEINKEEFEEKKTDI